MSAASDKNRQALEALLGSAALAARLVTTRVAVVGPARDSGVSAALLTEVLADTLGRLWPNIDFSGETAEVGLQAARSAASSGEALVDGLRHAWQPPYDVIISVGGRAAGHDSPEIVVGADDWRVGFGDSATCGTSPNPVGPAFAAALAAAQVFATCFAKELEDFGVKQLDDWQADVRELFGAPELDMKPIDLERTHIFGVGAVTHSLVWLLERWPEPVVGMLDLVDRDDYGGGNGQRYAFMPPEAMKKPKVALVADRLRKHPGLNVTPHRTDLNTFCLERGYDRALGRVITGLDSEESRRQAALKLPDRTINMWTSGRRIGAGQYVPGDDRGCLACAYPEPTDTPLDETAKFARATNLLPGLVRELLNSARGLTQEEAQTVASTRSVPVERLVGEPIRSVMPVLCATASVAPDFGKEAVDVPFAFSSLMAGVAGFIMLLRDIQLRKSVSEGWTQHMFKKPACSMMSSQGVDPACVRCQGFGLLLGRRSSAAD